MQSRPTPVSIVEFGDFECPACKSFQPALDRVATQFGDSVGIVFVHLPLSIHRFAKASARAAECAADQGMFSSFSRLLYEKQDSIGLKTWQSYATETGVKDSALFQKCLADPQSLHRVEAGMSLAEQLRVKRTPTIMINGWLFDEIPTEAQMVKAVADILAGRTPRFENRAE
jgi:protein-disulfide isomerase